MSIFNYIAFTGSVACLFTGLYVFTRYMRSRSHFLFFMICLSLSLLNMFFIPAYASATREGILFWTEFASVCVNFFYAFNLHFYIELNVKRKLNALVTALLYLPGLFIIIFFALRPLSVLDYVMYQGSWKMVPAFGSIYFYAASGYALLYCSATLVMILLFIRRASCMKEHKQGVWLLFNFGFSTALGAAAMWVIPFFNYNIPNIGPLYHLLYTAGLIYSVFKFKMMELKPAIVAEEIIAHIDDMVLLLAPDLKITFANVKAESLLAAENSPLTGRIFSVLAEETASLNRCFQDIREKVKNNVSMSLSIGSRTGPVMANTYISPVRDKFGDIIGFLVIIKENRGRAEFQRNFRITGREMEIVDLTVSGLSSREIGGRLNISDRTVQSHQEHIYQKLGVAGKVELISMVHEYFLPVREV